VRLEVKGLGVVEERDELIIRLRGGGNGRGDGQCRGGSPAQLCVGSQSGSGIGERLEVQGLGCIEECDNSEGSRERRMGSRLHWRGRWPVKRL
jgi:hypothetical protein